MLTEYIRAAMLQATYSVLEDDKSFFGRIPGLQGVWGNAMTVEACRDELQEVLEEWIVLGLRLGHTLPIVDDINLTPEFEPVSTWVEELNDETQRRLTNAL